MRPFAPLAVVLLFVLSVSILFSTLDAGINPEKSVEWLLERQNPDGSFSLPYYDGVVYGGFPTLLSVLALQNAASLYRADKQALREYVRSIEKPLESAHGLFLLSRLGIDDAGLEARFINTTMHHYLSPSGSINVTLFNTWIALLFSKISKTDQSMSSLRQLVRDWLVKAQNNDGSFGWLNSRGNTKSTSWAAMALTDLGADENVLERTIEWLLSRQLASGGFEETEESGIASVSTTGYATLALRQKRAASAARLESAFRFIAAHQLLDGGFEDITTWRLGFRSSDGEATAVAVWAMGDLTGRMSPFWYASRLSYTYMFTSSAMLVTASSLILLPVVEYSGRLRKSSRSLRFARLLHKKALLKDLLLGVAVPGVGLVFSHIPYVAEFVVVLFLLRFNLGQRHRVSLVWRGITTVLPLATFIYVRDAAQFISKTLPTSTVGTHQVVATLSQIADTVITAVALLAAVVLVTALILTYATDWEKTSLKLESWFGSRTRRTKISYFWGKLTVQGITNARFQGCLFESIAFYLILFVTTLLSVSWLFPSESTPAYWYAVMMLVWTGYDISIIGTAGTAGEERLWDYGIRVFRSPWSILSILVMLFTIAVSVGALSTTFYTLSYFLPSLFENVDRIQLYGWMSDSIRWVYTSLVLMELAGIGVGVLTIGYLGIFPVIWAYRLLKAEATGMIIQVNSLPSVVSGITLTYLSALLFFYYYRVLENQLSSELFIEGLSSQGLALFNVMLIGFAISAALVFIQAYFARSGVGRASVGSRIRRLFAALLFGPLILILSLAYPPIGLLIALAFIACILGWAFGLRVERGATRFQRLSDMLLTISFTSCGIFLILIGGLASRILSGYLFLMTVPHIAQMCGGRDWRQRVAYLLGFYGREID